MGSTGTTTSPSHPHVALLAFPFGTHAGPLFALANAIAAAAPPGVVLSFVSTAPSLAALAYAGKPPANLRLVPISDGMGEETAGLAMSEQERIGMFLAAIPGSLRAALDAAVAGAHGAAVSCVVADAFLWMAREEAEAMGAPWLALYTGGPASMFAHLHTDLLRDTVGVQQGITHHDELLHSIPALSSQRIGDLPEGIVFGPLDSPFSRLLYLMGQNLPKATAVLLNSFSGLDPEIDAFLKANFAYPLQLGPLHLLSPCPGPDPETNLCVKWLDRHSPAKVVYISFGTVAVLPHAELAELARGLEASGAAYLWSIKDPGTAQLPPGFLDRTKERGLIVDWVPQVQLLRHAAVGAFVTHCGWNSVLEAAAAGVPMLCRPFLGDQRMNARTVVDVWKIGVLIEGGAMTKETVERSLEVVLKSEEGKRMKTKAGELKAMAARAILPGESSIVNFHKFLELAQICDGLMDGLFEKGTRVHDWEF